MICPNCRHVSLGETVCSICAKPFSPEATDTTLAGENSNSPWSLKSTALGIATLAAWALVIFLSYLRTFRWTRGTFNPEARGYLIGGVLTPALVSTFVVWLINRARREKMSTQYKHGLIASLASFISIVSFVGSLQHPSGPPTDLAVKQQMRHLLKQATGKEAATNANWYDEPARQFFRDMLSFNQEYTQSVRAVHAPAAKLYTPASYAKRSNLQATISELQELLQVNKRYESLQPVLAKLEASAAAASASDENKQDFLKGVHSTADNTLALRADTFRAEKEWIQASLELYQFNQAHFSDYQVRGNKLLFRNDTSRLQFQELQSQAIALHKATLESKSKLDASRAAASARFGINLSDVTSTQDAK